MATANWYGRLQYTVNGQNRNIGSNVAPVQTTYNGVAYEGAGTVATATALQIFSSAAVGVAQAATWSVGAFTCDQDTRLILVGNSDADTSMIFVPADFVMPFPKYQITEYSATLGTRIDGTLESIEQIWIYQASGSTANWQLVLLD